MGTLLNLIFVMFSSSYWRVTNCLDIKSILVLILTHPYLLVFSMQISNVADDHISKLEKKYAVGKKVRARIIGFRVMDGLAIVSLKVVSTSHSLDLFFLLQQDLHSESLLHTKPVFGIHCFELATSAAYLFSIRKHGLS